MQELQFTFAMIKPDAVAAKDSGKIIDIIEAKGFEIMRLHKVHLTEEAAQDFYAVHKDRPFFGELVEFVTSGPVIIMALAKENAVADWRELMGATDPKKADKGTIRAEFGTDIGHNAVHGSDSVENAQAELALFFVDEMEECDDLDQDEDEDDYEDEEDHDHDED